MRSERNGFTMIELLVAVLIIGVLAAVMVPRLLGQRDRARDSAAVNAVRIALGAAETYYYTNDQSFAGLKPSTLKALEPALYRSAADMPPLTWTPGPHADPTRIAIFRFDGTPVTETSGVSLSASVILCSVSEATTIVCVYSERYPTTAAVHWARLTDDRSGQFSLSDINGAGAGARTPNSISGVTWRPQL